MKVKNIADWMDHMIAESFRSVVGSIVQRWFFPEHTHDIGGSS